MSWLIPLCLLLTACHHSAPVAVATPPGGTGCALIVTDDDIPSGSATAGAMYVSDAAEGRRLLTADVADVVQGFHAAGFACVHVLDGHEEALDRRALRAIDIRVITPRTTPSWVVPFLGPMEERYAVAALVGFHAAAGQEGFRAHTINDAVRRLGIDGREGGEVTHLALGLGSFDVPVGLVVGDEAAVAEALALLPGVRTVKVRWHEGDGSTGFLTREQAGPALQAAARQAAEQPPAPWHPETPIRLSLSTGSAERMAAAAPRFAAVWTEEMSGLAAALAERPDLAARLIPDPMADARVTLDTLSWTEADPLVAFATVALVASSVRPSPGAWNLVSAGYSAWNAGHHDKALAAYQEALAADPLDVATHCRMAAVLQDLGRLDEARIEFSYGFDRPGEVGDSAMQAWCARGLAEVATAQGDLATARRATLELLALSRKPDSLAKARQALDAMAAGAIWPTQGGLEGFYPVERLDAAFMQARALPMAPERIAERLPRVGKMEIPAGMATLSLDDFAMERSAWCGSARARLFNPTRCAGYDEATCDGGLCTFPAWRNCSGLFVSGSRLVTAAHCVEGWSDEATGHPGTILRASLSEEGWRVERLSVGSVLPLKRSWDDGWVIHAPSAFDRIDAALVEVASPDGRAAPDLSPIAPAPMPESGAFVWVLGFPRNETRPADAMARAGYDLVHGEPGASFGRIRDPNAADAPLCSVTGLQDEWAIRAPCPSEKRAAKDEGILDLGLITESPFLIDIDTINGYSGAPIFDAEGRWVGIMDTVYGADPRQGFAPEMRVVAVKAVRAWEGLGGTAP